jgi:hypothetical protein
MKDTKEIVDLLFEFLNTDFDSMTKTDFVTPIYSYTQFVCHSADKYDFISLKLKNKQLIDDMLNIPTSRISDEIFDTKKAFLSEVQKHLKSRVDNIISDNTSGGEIPLIGEIRGKRKISVVFDQENGKRLKETFTPDEEYISADLNLESEKIIADLALVDLFFDYDIRVDSFRNCENCGKYFFEISKRPKVFCSDLCASAARQKKYRLSKNKEKKGTKKKA